MAIAGKQTKSTASTSCVVSMAVGGYFGAYIWGPLANTLAHDYVSNHPCQTPGANSRTLGHD